MDKKDYTHNEESYAKEFYLRLSNVKYMASKLGGRYPCLRTDNKVFFDCLDIKTSLLFKEIGPKQLKLTLEMSFVGDDTKKVVAEASPVLSDESGGGMLSEKMIKIIFNGFLIPALKDFYRMKH